MKKSNSKKLPLYFKPILWSYNFSEINPDKHKKIIIVHTINYGDLKHWRWIADYYGREDIKDSLSKITITEIRPRIRRLAALIFGVKNFNYAPRGTR